MEDNEILENLKNGAYDFIANNYYKLSSEQMRDIILEILVQFKKQSEYDSIINDLIYNLINYRDWEDSVKW